MSNGHRYLVKTACFTLFFLGLLAAFNAAIDPYQLFHTPAIAGLNDKKTDIFFQLAVTKPYQFYAGDNANVVLGSSRTGRAIDPNHQALSDQGFYNYATPGSTPEYDYLKLRSAIASKPVKHIYYFVDFFTFNTYYNFPTYMKKGNSRRTAPGTIQYMRQVVEDFGANLLSYHTIRASAQTIRKQPAADSGAIATTTLRANGRWNRAFPSDRQIEEAFTSAENAYLHQIWFPQADGRF